MPIDGSLVVEAKQRYHVAHVVLAGDSAGCRSAFVGEDRVVFDPALLEQLVPGVLGEAEVGRPVAVEVPDRSAGPR